MKHWKVIMADDHQLFLDGLRFILREHDDEYKIVGTSNTGTGLLLLLKELATVDLVILDIQMPEMNGVETSKSIKSLYPHVHILIISMNSHITFIKKLLRIGVDGYILKENSHQELWQALTSIKNGKTFYSAEITQAITDDLSPHKKRSGLNQIRLTKREFEVLQLVAEGLTTDQISIQLFVASSTIISHRKNIMRKLDVKNGAEMIRLSTEMGLLA